MPRKKSSSAYFLQDQTHALTLYNCITGEKYSSSVHHMTCFISPFCFNNLLPLGDLLQIFNETIVYKYITFFFVLRTLFHVLCCNWTPPPHYRRSRVHISILIIYYFNSSSNNKKNTENPRYDIDLTVTLICKCISNMM